MRREFKRRNKVIYLLIGVLFLMTIGYAAFSTNLNIGGTSNITNKWDVEIINVTNGTPTGTAENTQTPIISSDKTSVSIAANLYAKGDAMTYVVTVKNKGTLDAKLDEISQNLVTQNNAVKITITGYTKGERLNVNETKDITVKIEYNQNYQGTIDYNTPAEVELAFNYTQGSGNSTNPSVDPIPETHLITYNYTENGGTSSQTENEYLEHGTVVTLNKTATKSGYTFLGWNTNKDATTGLSSVTLNANTTVYAIFKKEISVTYEKGDYVTKIGNKTNNYTDTYILYNNEFSIDITLPSITSSVTDVIKEWYKGNEIIGVPNDTYTVVEDTTLLAKVTVLPVIKSWSSGASTDFHAEEYRTNITSVIFEDDINIPAGATSWDVSATANSGSVMAWVTADPEDNTKYVLHIAGDGGVIANSNSSFMFFNFTNLKAIDFDGNFDTSNATNMTYMFRGCSSLTSLELDANFDTSKVKNTSYMFNNCSGLTSLDLGENFDTSSVTNMSNMFYGCSGLTSLDLGDSFDTSNVTDMSAMFYNCSGLTSLDLGENFDTSNATSMASMFYGCSGLTSLDLGDSFDTSNVTDMYNMFYNCSGLTSLDLGENFDTGNVTSMVSMFRTCSSLTSLDLGDKFDTSNVIDMAQMFYNCSGLTSIDLGDNFDTSSVTVMSEMFYNCSNLTSLDLGDNFDTSKVTTMYYMFYGCSSLISLDLGDNFDTSSVTNMFGMFRGCSGLTSLDLGENFDTSRVTDMQYMFSHCSGLTSLDLGDNFDTSNITDMRHMFEDCSSLTSLDLSSFDTSNVTNMQSMFSSCTNLKTIYASSDFVTTGITTTSNGNYMFTSDTKLVGGNGTVFSSSHINKDYAVIDTPSTPGYFTNGTIPIINNVSSTSTTNSITVVVDASVAGNPARITKYEYSLDGGSTWQQSANNAYTFTGLPKDTGYHLKVRVTADNNSTATYDSYGVDSSVPTNSLLYWGVADNSSNTSTTLKNKVSGTDGTLTNFNNNASSGFNNNTLVFDGTNDYVNIGLANYNFNNSITYLVYAKVEDFAKSNYIFGNWEGAGAGLGWTTGSQLFFEMYDGSAWQGLYQNPITSQYYTIVGTYDGTTEKLYLDGVLLNSKAVSNMLTSTVPVVIGGNPNASSITVNATMSLKEAMLYDRALTATEISALSDNLHKKYQAQTKSIEPAKYSETAAVGSKTVTMTFPSECGSTYTCTYTKDGGTAVSITSTTATATFTQPGTLVTSVSDGNSSSTSSYTVSFLTATTGSCASLTYNGSSRTLASGGTGVTYSNNSRTNAGSQTVTVTANAGYLFSDNTSSKTLSCSISKCTPTITLSASSGTIYYHETATFTATVKPGTNCPSAAGTLKATTSSSTYATVSPTSKSITATSAGVATTETVTAQAAGSATITMSFTPTDTTNFNSAATKTYTATTKKEANCVSNKVFAYDYTGGIQTFTAPCKGTYKLEVWGASSNRSNTGLGSYSVGTMTVTRNTKLYIGVGGQGTRYGGYNGGGNATYPSYSNSTASGGGGATHIAITTNRGVLANYASYKSEIIMVAGGGGGTGSGVTDPSYSGGSGGGYIGNHGGGAGGGGSGGNGMYSAWGGTQTAGGSVYNQATPGSFGKGGAATQTTNLELYFGGGGGGGYYGGGGGGTAESSNPNRVGSGGGGSGYIGYSGLSNKYMITYCGSGSECYTSTATATKTISSTSYSSTATADKFKYGNGYAKITLTSIS